MAPRILGPKNQLIKVTENNRTFLDCPFFGSPFPLLRWWAYVPLFEKNKLMLKSVSYAHQGSVYLIKLNYIAIPSNIMNNYYSFK